MSKEGINVCIRVRSLIQREIDAGEVRGQDWIVDAENNTIRSNTEGKKPMLFDRVFDDYSTNIDVYDEASSHIIDSALQGINGTILAYGQTSSGKTYTMTSIMQQGFAHIFQHIAQDKTRQYSVQASYAEVYNEVIIDLSNKNDKNLRIDENSGTIANLTRKAISCPDDLFDFLRAGAGNRHVSKTNMNAESSRSHSIFQVMIESVPAGDDPSTTKSVTGAKQTLKTGGKLVSIINFVDLAGSERAKATGAAGDVFKEGVQINASLSALGKVIRALSSNGRHIPYRESKLTQLLKPSLGGNSRTTMICCVTPCRANIPETKSTLSFAYQAKSVVNTVGVNEILDDKQVIIRLREKIVVLERKLSSIQDVVQQLKEQGINVSDLELLLARQFVNQQAGASSSSSSSTSSSFVPNTMVKRQRHISSTGIDNASDGDSHFVNLPPLPDIPSHITTTVRPMNIKACGVQTDFSVLRKRKQLTHLSNTQEVSSPQHPQDDHDDDDSPSSNHTIDKDMSVEDPAKIANDTSTIIYANPSRVMSYLGVMTAGGNPLLSDFIDEDVSTLDDDLTQMLVNHGFTDHKKYQEQISSQAEEISRLRSQLSSLNQTYEQATSQLQGKLDELNLIKSDEIAQLQVIIQAKEEELSQFTNMSSEKYHDMEIQLTRSTQELDHLRKHNELIQAQYDALVNDIKSTIDKEIAQYNAREQELLERIDKLTSELDEGRTSISQLELEYEKIIKEQEDELQLQLNNLTDKKDQELRQLQDQMERSREELAEAHRESTRRAHSQHLELVNELEECTEQLESERIAFEEKIRIIELDSKQQIAELKSRLIQEEKRTLEYKSKVEILQHENDQKMKLIDDIRESKEREMSATEDRIKLMAGDKAKIIATLESELTTLKTYKQQQQSLQESFQRQLKSLQDDLALSRTEVTQLRATISQKDEKIEQIKSQTEAFLKKHREKMDSDTNTKIDKYKLRIDELNAIITEKTNDIRAEKEKVNNFKEQIRDKVYGYKDQIFQLQKDKITFEQEISSLKKQLEQQQHRINSLSQERQSYQAKSNALVEKIRELDRRASDEQTLKKHHEEQYTLLRREYDRLDMKYKQELDYMDRQHEDEKLQLIRKIQQIENEFKAEKERAVIESNRSASLQLQLDKLMTQNRQLTLASATGSSSGPSSSSSSSSSFYDMDKYGIGNRMKSSVGGIYEDTSNAYDDDEDTGPRTRASKYRSPFKNIISGFGPGNNSENDGPSSLSSNPLGLKSSLRSTSTNQEPVKLIEPVRFNRGRLGSRREKQ